MYGFFIGIHLRDNLNLEFKTFLRYKKLFSV
jgi:hypothetical protein